MIAARAKFMLPNNADLRYVNHVQHARQATGRTRLTSLHDAKIKFIVRSGVINPRVRVYANKTAVFDGLCRHLHDVAPRLRADAKPASAGLPAHLDGRLCLTLIKRLARLWGAAPPVPVRHGRRSLVRFASIHPVVWPAA